MVAGRDKEREIDGGGKRGGHIHMAGARKIAEMTARAWSLAQMSANISSGVRGALGDVSGGAGVSVEGDGGLLCDLGDFTDHDFVEGVDEGEVRGVHDNAVVLECYYCGGQHLDHIREVWVTLLGHNKNPTRKVDQATVESVELQAPWALTLDAKTLRGQVLGGEIFDCFHEQDRVQIWSRLQAVDGLIPSLFTLFENVKYLKSTPIA